MTYELPLSQGLVAIVDDVDVSLAQHKWSALVRPTTAYAIRPVVRNGRKTTTALHREILGVTDPSIHVDHRNNDGLDNRRSNLRVATLKQNNRNQGPRRNNTSGYKGVRFREDRGRWLARIHADGQTTHLGYHDTAEKAALAYDEAARELHGEFAWTNFPLDPKYQGDK